LKKLFTGITLLFVTVGLSQQSNKINATIDTEKGAIEVSQIITFTNHTNKALDSLYLYDWNHAYNNTSTPLSKKLSEEFNFKFERSRSNEKGKTSIHQILSEKKPLQWRRLEKQIDIIVVDLIQPLLPGTSQDIFISYTLQLPSSTFTGYGIDPKQNINFRNGFLQLANQSIDGHWYLDSNYGFHDMSASHSKSTFSICFPENYTIIPSAKGDNQEGCWRMSGALKHNFNFYLKKEHDFRVIASSGFEIRTDMANDFENEVYDQQIMRRFQAYLERYFGNISDLYFLVDSAFYEQQPIVGFDVLLNTLKPIPKHEQFELKSIQTLLRKIVQSKFPGNFRQNKWIADGLSHYLFMRYVEDHFPTLSLIGNLSQLPLISSYDFAKAPFTFKTNLQAAFVYRKNLTQPLNTPIQNLTKYNRKIAHRSRAAMGLKILEKTQGKGNIDDFIFNIFTVKNLKNPMAIQDHFELFFSDKVKWFNEDYATETSLTDYSIRQKNKSNYSIQVELINHTKAQNPVNVCTYQDDQLISSVWVTGGEETEDFLLNTKEVDKIVVNPNQFVLETNTNNNSLVLGKPFKKRQKRFRLYEDIPSPAHKSTYFTPNLTYNAYDGLLLGMVFHNGLVFSQPSTFFVSPLYATNKKNLAGSFSVLRRSYFQDRKLSAITYRFGLKSFHFDENNRYYRISPEIFATFKPEGLSSNKRSTIGLQFISLIRENSIQNNYDDFYVGSLSYSLANSNSAISKVFGVNIQVGESFQKFAASYRNRKYYTEARQYTYRLFLGFLADTIKSGNYDFGISRVNDYSFSFNFLGRSERSGIYSQQYVLADAGFKSFIPVQSANQWVWSSNLSTTIWRSFELYGDVGWIKNKGKKFDFIYDAGFNLNLLQDYLALYFPVYSNLGWEVNDASYATKIRFSLSLEASDIISLFNRSWF
jgi:hypothetical protein